MTPSLLTKSHHSFKLIFNFETQQYINLFRDKTLAAQNVRSFNCSDLSFRSTQSKLFSILHGNPDIIFISEVKLSNPSFVTKITDFLKFRNYSFYVNSSNSSRGVAIIIKNTLFHTATIIHKCPSENALLLKLTSGPLNIDWQLCVAYLDNIDSVEYLNLLTKKFDGNIPWINSKFLKFFFK